MSGKGDKQRPTDPNKFSEGYDRIWGKRTGAEEALKAQREYSKRVRERLDDFATRPVIKAFTDAIKSTTVYMKDGEVIPVWATFAEAPVEMTCGNCKHWVLYENKATSCNQNDVFQMVSEWFSPPADFGCNKWEMK